MATSWAWLADIITCKSRPAVLYVVPIEEVVCSLNVIVSPFHVDIILPTVEFEAEIHVKSKYALSYELVLNATNEAVDEADVALTTAVVYRDCGVLPK